MVSPNRWFSTGRKLVGTTILIVWLTSVVWLVKPVATLNSLEQVDDYPLYAMHYYGAYDQAFSAAQVIQRLASAHPPRPDQADAGPAWACSLFAAFGDSDHKLYGRNFDWQFSPAVLLFSDPPDGYASVSMVDIAYLGFGRAEVRDLTRLPLPQRRALLYAPYLPFDGMNEHGLVVGMAAVPGSQMPHDPDRETVDSLMAMRRALDHARDVDEALALLGSYNIEWGGGPPLHYLLADPSGHSVLVEFYRGQMEIIPNQAPWHLATNFLRVAAGDSPQGRCRRYDTIQARLSEAEGHITPGEAMELLREVSQTSTQWSVVYEMSSGEVNVAMGRGYEKVHGFNLSLARE